jgi:hypothetical protein
MSDKQSIAAGGLAVEIQRLADQRAIPAVALCRNRRQEHPADRQALARLRAGAVDDSRTIRTEHGWDHQLDGDRATRQALAEAAVRDGDRHGRDQVAVLAVTHADCEDLADRIRGALAARGELRGPTLSGPSWSGEPRRYAAGDRILVHANLDPGNRVFNGATGSLLSVTAAGAVVAFDDGHCAYLPAELVGGCRGDATPNLSHAWARTIDGAQGGTWTQVHLIGTPALDQLSGYVAQSRGRQPTHTWHTVPDPDHPQSLLADQRTPAEVVTDHMRRAQPKTFAATDDPWTLDRVLRRERDEQAEVIATRPADPQRQLDQARTTAERAVDDQQAAVRRVAYRQAERDRLTPLHRLRRGGRADIYAADQALAAARRCLEDETAAVRALRTRVGDLEQALAARAAWDHEHQWRIDRVVALDDQLAHHWASVTLNAVRADDPLAFGVQAVRDARATYQAEHEAILRKLPPDRSQKLTHAHHERHRAQEQVRSAEQRLDDAHDRLHQARQRHWGRRDKSATVTAEVNLKSAELALLHCRQAEETATEGVAREEQALKERARALRETSREREQFSAATRDLADALDRTRPERVVGATLDPADSLWTMLGPPPPTRGGLNAWCGLAQQIVAAADQRSDALAPHELGTVVTHAPEIIELASDLDPGTAPNALADRPRWQQSLHATVDVLTAERPTPVLEQGLGLEL